MCAAKRDRNATIIDPTDEFACTQQAEEHKPPECSQRQTAGTIDPVPKLLRPQVIKIRASSIGVPRVRSPSIGASEVRVSSIGASGVRAPSIRGRFSPLDGCGANPRCAGVRRPNPAAAERPRAEPEMHGRKRARPGSTTDGQGPDPQAPRAGDRDRLSRSAEPPEGRNLQHRPRPQIEITRRDRAGRRSRARSRPGRRGASRG